MRAVQDFFKEGRLLREVNHTFVTLIPKIEGAKELRDFRPISCCNLIYKLITKIMCQRMESIMAELISANPIL